MKGGSDVVGGSASDAEGADESADGCRLVAGVMDEQVPSLPC